MILLDGKVTPMWTDIVQAIGVLLGVPLAIWGIIKLFIKDKAQDEIANHQKNVLNEFSKQTMQFEYQTNHLKQGNRLLAEQIKILNEAFLSDKEYKERIEKNQREQRKNDIKPYFKRRTGGMNQANFDFTLTNLGGKATIVELKPGHNVTNVNKQTKENLIDKNGEMNIYGMANKNLYGIPVDFELIFKDADNTVYVQEFKKDGMNNWTVSEPTEKTNQ